MLKNYFIFIMHALERFNDFDISCASLARRQGDIETIMWFYWMVSSLQLE